MKLSEAVREIIRLGDASRVYWDRELPKHHPRYPVIRAGEDSGPPPPEDAQILTLLNNLPEDEVYALLLLLYVGCGDYHHARLCEPLAAMTTTPFDAYRCRTSLCTRTESGYSLFKKCAATCRR